MANKIKQNLLKIMLVAIEVLTIVFSVYKILNLIIAIFYYKFSGNLNPAVYEMLALNYTVSIGSDSIYKDITINVTGASRDMSSPLKAIALLNTFKINKSDPHLVDKLNQVGIERCFLFTQGTIAEGLSFLRYLHSYSVDLWSILILITLVLFLLFMRITLSKKLFKEINLVKNYSTPFLSYLYNYNYHVYFMSIIIILSGLYMDYFYYVFNPCFGFDTLNFNTIIYNRKFITSSFDESHLLVDGSLNHQNPFINFYTSNILKHKSIEYTLLIAFLCVTIWISRVFDFFDLSNKPGFLFCVFAMAFWIFFLILTTPIYIDWFIFHFRLVFYDFRNILIPNTFVFILFNFIFLFLDLSIIGISLYNYCFIDRRIYNRKILNDKECLIEVNCIY